ncbi:hypothetical protein [Tabrizicola sp.]|uniref:hypothetical protein n=1 Tax=Tabrizicola sp. TaxID=2005166 RepID=UPI0027372F06|nr:hypothetical protein [Tabrizicola sp.]MDP3197410.1 hypothetical protein [Tabrizicola sp.]
MKNRYFVIDPDQIVADDLAHAIRVNDPAAEVIVFPTPEAALGELAIRPPRAVLIHHEPKGFQRTPAGRALQSLEVPYAFRGMVSEAEAEGAHVLASPFNENTVADLLRQLLGDSQG